VVVALATALPVVLPVAAQAHPLGNFSINHYSALRTEADSVLVRYVVDLAEIPTFQDVQDRGLVLETGHPSLAAYVGRRAEALKDGLRLEVDGRRLGLRVEARDITFTPGAGGLPTMRIDLTYRGRLERGVDTVVLTYQDGNDTGRAGWREIVAAAGPGTTLAETTAPAADLSRGLMDYPADRLQRPPQDVSARIVFTREVAAAEVRPAARDAHATAGELGMTAVRAPGTGVARPAVARAPAASEPAASIAPEPSVASRTGEVGTQAARPAPAASASVEATGPWLVPPAGKVRPGAAAVSRRPGTPPSALTELVTTSGLGVGIALSALAIAAGLGALHALEPGHGKTVVAAYLVGARGTTRHAVILGLIVTASHTAGVYLLGAATLYASRYVVPDRLYPWLAAGSGLAIAGLGVVLFLRRVAGRDAGHHHEHGHHHPHGHDDTPDHPCGHIHDHGHAHGEDGRARRDHHHADDDHGHAHDHGHHHLHEYPPNVSLGQLFTLGVSGGIVPCPAALVVLLSAISLRRVGFGLLLVAAFSAGLAAVLVAIGILMVHARKLMARFTAEGPIVHRWLPLASSAAVAMFGVVIAVQALAG